MVAPEDSNLCCMHAPAPESLKFEHIQHYTRGLLSLKRKKEPSYSQTPSVRLDLFEFWATRNAWMPSLHLNHLASSEEWLEMKGYDCPNEGIDIST